MNIVCATDNNFVQHCAVTLISILKNNPQGTTIYLLTEGLSIENNLALNELVNQNGGKLYIVNVDSESLKNCPMPDLSNLEHISIATYYRLLIPHLLPDNIDKVIYLDCDIVVKQSLMDLWNTEIEDFAIGAVYQITNRTLSDAERLNYPVEYGYFNAGVLLINVNYWRDNKISEKLFDFLIANRNIIIYHDQDALNGVLYDKCYKLHIKWNMLTIFFMKSTLKINDIYEGKIVNDYADYKKEMTTSINNPAIIHYVSKPKPWDAMCDHPLEQEYYKYLSLTQFKNYNPPSLFHIFIINPSKLYLWVKEIMKKLIRGNPYLPIIPN